MLMLMLKTMQLVILKSFRLLLHFDDHQYVARVFSTIHILLLTTGQLVITTSAPLPSGTTTCHSLYIISIYIFYHRHVAKQLKRDRLPTKSPRKSNEFLCIRWKSLERVRNRMVYSSMPQMSALSSIRTD